MKIFPLLLAAFLMCCPAACGPCGDDDPAASPGQADDDDNDDSPAADDDAADDDLSDDDTSADDDTGDDDIVMPKGWQAPCDVNDDGLDDYLLQEQYVEDGVSYTRLKIKDTAGNIVYDGEPIAVGSAGFVTHLLENLDADDSCEIVRLEQFIDNSAKAATVRSRVQVLDNGELAVVYDGGWRENVYGSIQLGVDLNLDRHTELLVTYRPRDVAGAGSMEVLDPMDGFAELWSVDGENGEGLRLHAQVVSGGLAMPCGENDKRLFLVEHYDLYDETSPQWRAEWHNLDSGPLNSFGPFPLAAPAQRSAGIVHATPAYPRCLAYAITVDPAGDGRYFLFDDTGEPIIAETIAELSTLAGNGLMSPDGNDQPDLVMWGRTASGAPALWVAADTDDYQARQVASGIAGGYYQAAAWPLLPWLNGPADILGDQSELFAVLGAPTGLTGTLDIPLYGTDLLAAGFAYQLPLPSGGLLAASLLPFFIDGDRAPALGVYAVGSTGAPAYTMNSRWAVFAGDDPAPLYLSEAHAGRYVYLSGVYDLDGNNVPELAETLYPLGDAAGGEVKLHEIFSDRIILDEKAPDGHYLTLIGQWR